MWSCVSVVGSGALISVLILLQAVVWIQKDLRGKNIAQGLYICFTYFYVLIFHVAAVVSLWRVWSHVDQLRADPKIIEPFRSELYGYVIFWLVAPPLWFF